MVGFHTPRGQGNMWKLTRVKASQQYLKQNCYEVTEIDKRSGVFWGECPRCLDTTFIFILENIIYIRLFIVIIYNKIY